MDINSFSFLNVKICRDNNRLSTFVYNRKPVFRRFFTNFKNVQFTPYYIVALILLPVNKNFIMK